MQGKTETRKITYAEALKLSLQGFWLEFDANGIARYAQPTIEVLQA